MAASRASSVYSTDSAWKPPSTHRREQGSSVDTRSKPGSFQAAKEYAEALGSVSMRTPPPLTSPSPSPSPSLSLSTQLPGSQRAPSPVLEPASPPHPQPPGPQYAAASAQSPVLASPRPSSRPSSSRPSSRPSFMNYQAGTAAETKRKPVAASPQQSVVSATPDAAGTNERGERVAGLLLVVVGGTEVYPSTTKYVEIALQKRRFDGIALVGRAEQAAPLKQLKVDMYSLIGRTGREMSVYMYVKDAFGERDVVEVVEEVRKGGGGEVQAVLCEVGYGSPETTAGTDLLSAEASTMQEAWETSVGFLHSVARATIPALVSTSPAQVQQPGSSASSFFSVLESSSLSPISSLHRAACDALLRQLRDGYQSSALAIGHAADILIPRAEPIQTNGNVTRRGDVYQDEPLEFTPGESPTKLWNMWALQEEIGADA